MIKLEVGQLVTIKGQVHEVLAERSPGEYQVVRAFSGRPEKSFFITGDDVDSEATA